MKKNFQLFAVSFTLVCIIFSQARAQDESELARKTLNPVADLISVPLPTVV